MNNDNSNRFTDFFDMIFGRTSVQPVDECEAEEVAEPSSLYLVPVPETEALRHKLSQISELYWGFEHERVKLHSYAFQEAGRDHFSNEGLASATQAMLECLQQEIGKVVAS